jgi:uncharacterized membrane protein (Fun14 family)
MATTASDQAPRALTPLQIGILALLAVALLGSVGWRYYQKKEGKGGVPAAGGHTLVDDGKAPRTEPTPLERSLPYVTEGSLFGLIGFALGYASRKFVKLGLIALALFFVGLQALVWTGTVSVDWSGLLGKLNALIFNLRENESMSAFLTRRIPSGGGMLLGYLVGFQRG